MLIIFTESVLLYHFKGFILEIKTRQYKRREVRVVLLHKNEKNRDHKGRWEKGDCYVQFRTSFGLNLISLFLFNKP